MHTPILSWNQIHTSILIWSCKFLWLILFFSFLLPNSWTKWASKAASLAWIIVPSSLFCPHHHPQNVRAHTDCGWNPTNRTSFLWNPWFGCSHRSYSQIWNSFLGPWPLCPQSNLLLFPTSFRKLYSNKTFCPFPALLWETNVLPDLAEDYWWRMLATSLEMVVPGCSGGCLLPSPLTPKGRHSPFLHFPWPC